MYIPCTPAITGLTMPHGDEEETREKTRKKPLHMCGKKLTAKAKVMKLLTDYSTLRMTQKAAVAALPFLRASITSLRHTITPKELKYALNPQR